MKRARRFSYFLVFGPFFCSILYARFFLNIFLPISHSVLIHPGVIFLDLFHRTEFQIENKFVLFPDEFIYHYSLSPYISCRPCNFSPENYFSDSSPSDVIFTSCCFFTRYLFQAVHSIRTTGCRATIFYLVDSTIYKKYLMKPFKPHFANCNCFFWCYGTLNGSTKKVIFGARLVSQYLFTANFEKYFKRGFHFDAHDTFFQGDPFSSHIYDPEAIVGLRQSNTLYTSPTDLEWMTDTVPLGTELSQFLPLPILNSGVYFGPIPLLKEYFLFSLKHFLLNTTADQGLYNYLYYSGELGKNGFHFKFLPVNVFYLAHPDPTCFRNNISNLVCTTVKGQIPPMLIHHVDLEVNGRMPYTICDSRGKNYDT